MAPELKDMRAASWPELIRARAEQVAHVCRIPLGVGVFGSSKDIHAYLAAHPELTAEPWIECAPGYFYCPCAPPGCGD